MQNNRSTCAFSALMLIAGLGHAQSILTAGKPATPAPAAATKAIASPAPPPPTMAAAAAPAPAPASKVVVTSMSVEPRPALSIAELANQQAKALSDEAVKKVKGAGPVERPVRQVPELMPVEAIGVVMDKDAKAAPIKPSAPPPPPRPYLAFVGGMAGQEVAEIHNGSMGSMVRPGDSIGPWKVLRVAEGKVFLQNIAPAKKTKKGALPNERVLSVGEFL